MHLPDRDSLQEAMSEFGFEVTEDSVVELFPYDKCEHIDDRLHRAPVHPSIRRKTADLLDKSQNRSWKRLVDTYTIPRVPVEEIGQNIKTQLNAPAPKYA